jgi:lysophosphatidate acyltransferase
LYPIVLKPIPTTNLKPSDVEDLTRDVRDLMLREHIALTATARGQPLAMTASAAAAQPKQTSPQQRDGVVKASGVEGTIS